MTFPECVQHCAAVPEFVAEFDRLSGTEVGRIGRKAPIDALIDEATGREEDDLRQFTAFVFAYVWVPLMTPAHPLPYTTHSPRKERP